MQFHRVAMWKIHILNPKQVRKFKESYNDLPKNDYIDAFVSADCLHFGRIKNEVYMDDYCYKALRNLTRARFYAVQNLAREKQRFGNLLFKRALALTARKLVRLVFLLLKDNHLYNAQ